MSSCIFLSIFELKLITATHFHDTSVDFYIFRSERTVDFYIFRFERTAGLLDT